MMVRYSEKTCGKKCVICDKNTIFVCKDCGDGVGRFSLCITCFETHHKELFEKDSKLKFENRNKDIRTKIKKKRKIERIENSKKVTETTNGKGISIEVGTGKGNNISIDKTKDKVYDKKNTNVTVNASELLKKIIRENNNNLIL